MSDLPIILARRAEIAETRKALDIEDAELEIAERVSRRLSGSAPSKMRDLQVVRPRAPRNIQHIPANFRNVLEGIAKHGPDAERDDVLAYVNSKRKEPLSPASFAARLSKMVARGLVIRVGTRLRAVPTGGADVS